MTAHPRLRRHPALLAASLAALLALAPLTAAPRAHATIGGCRSDPAVALSTGVTLDLSADIADAAPDVRRVAYTLHIPAGTRVLATTPTAGPLGAIESFTISADAARGIYHSATLVTTGAHGIAVTATTTLVSAATGAPLATGTASGYDRQPLRVRLAP